MTHSSQQSTAQSAPKSQIQTLQAPEKVPTAFSRRASLAQTSVKQGTSPSHSPTQSTSIHAEMPKPAIHNSKAAVTLPVMKKRETSKATNQAPLHNDPKPSTMFAKKTPPTHHEAQTTLQRSTSSRHPPPLSSPLPPPTHQAPSQRPPQSYTAQTISSSIHTHTPQKHDPSKVYLPYRNPRSSAGKPSNSKFVASEPWNSGDVEKHARNQRSLSILGDDTGLVVERKGVKLVEVVKRSVTAKDGGKVMGSGGLSESQSGSANIGSILNMSATTPISTQTPLTPHTTRTKHPTSSKPIKKPLIHTSRPPLAPPNLKQPSLLDSSMPSQITSQTSLTSLETSDTHLTLLDLLEIPLSEKYKRLREAYTTQRLFRSKIEKENKQLRDHISILNKRMVKDFNVQKHSLPLEATLNLKYQYQKRVDMERQKYEGLVDENHRLISRLKALEDETMRKLIDKRPLDSKNELLSLKQKYRDAQTDRTRLETSLKFTTQELESESAAVENLRNQLDFLKMHFGHLAPKAVQLFESEWMGIDEGVVRKGSKVKAKVDGAKSRQHSFVDVSGSESDSVKAAAVTMTVEAKHIVEHITPSHLSKEKSVKELVMDEASAESFVKELMASTQSHDTPPTHEPTDTASISFQQSTPAFPSTDNIDENT